MSAPLYLDTARLGQMSPRAFRASTDFARFANEHGCSLYLSKFLHEGFAAWPKWLQASYPGLSDWDGLLGLTTKLKAIAEADSDSEVVVAARSAELMRMAAKLLVRPCRNVLLTDLSWPAYERILAEERCNATCDVTRVNLRDAILRNRIDRQTVVDRICQAYVQHRCDGLFLPLVDTSGIQLPINDIADQIRHFSDIRFFVVDAAQAIGHVPLQLSDLGCDVVIAGCHKWLRAFTPLGMALFTRLGSKDYIRESLMRWRSIGEIDDPLLNFSSELLSGQTHAYGETVDPMPLITGNAAAADALQCRKWKQTSETRSTVMTIASESGWMPLAPMNDLSTKILLLESKTLQPGLNGADNTKRQFLSHGVALTAYDSRLVRLSFPDELEECEIHHLSRALSAIR